MKNYLVTGGAGFIGSNLIDNLVNSSNVICVDNFDDYYDSAIKRKNIEKHLAKNNFKLYETDITDYDALEKIFEENKIDCIINLAAKVGVRPSATQMREYTATNIGGMVNLLECARKYNVIKFIQASSSSVYGERTKIPFKEDENIDKQVSMYAATKAAGEKICYTYSNLYKININCLRFFTVYGPRQRPDMAINKFVKLISEDKIIQVYGDGSSKRDYTYVQDIVEGIIACIDYNKTPFEIFNLGYSNSIELKYLINLIEKTLQKKANIEFIPIQEGDVSITSADISKAEKLLNFAPKFSIETGIEEFIKWQNYESRKGID